MKIEVLTVNYNTPELVETLFLTISKFCSYKLNYTVVNNGPIKFICDSSIMILDFEKEAKEYIDKCKQTTKLHLRSSKSVLASAHHAYTIDDYIYNKSDADYILLFDTDIIIKENFDDKIKFLIESNQPLYSCKTPEDISGNRFMRVAAHCCFINRKLFTELGLRFLTLDKFLDITHTYAYDTGRGLLENVSKMNLQFFYDNSFFQHFKGISWKKIEGITNDSPNKSDATTSHSTCGMATIHLRILYIFDRCREVLKQIKTRIFATAKQHQRHKLWK